MKFERERDRLRDRTRPNATETERGELIADRFNWIIQIVSVTSRRFNWTPLAFLESCANTSDGSRFSLANLDKPWLARDPTENQSPLAADK